jgi:glycosyltransferase involved in cell wall biosynthesis
MTLVSVVVPVHNGERFLAEALGSITAQRDADVELIVVDDGSTDASPEIAARAVAAHGRGVVHHRPQGGVAAARNTGVGLSTAPFVAFCDQDDVWLEDKLARQVQYLDAHPGVGVVRVRQEPFLDGLDAPPAWLVPDKLYGDLGGVMPCSGLFRREVFDIVGVFDETKPGSDDTDWILRSRHRGVEVAVLPEILMRRRIHDANLTHEVEMLRDGYFRSIRDRVREHEQRD